MNITLPQIKNVQGIILYEGPSNLDKSPIVVIATGISKVSSNPKTGDMIQTWILKSDQNPVAAVKDGSDSTICGTCKHRPSLGNSCYVITSFAPLNIYKSYHKGNYIKGNDELYKTCFSGRKVRLGAYGDPAAVPYKVWDQILKYTSGHTGYTHMALDFKIDKRFKEILMASVDSVKEFEKAHNLGYRTFRVKKATDPVLKGEFICVASEEMGKKRTCETCMACDGADINKPRKGSVVINSHGIKKNNFNKIEN